MKWSWRFNTSWKFFWPPTSFAAYIRQKKLLTPSVYFKTFEHENNLAISWKEELKYHQSCTHLLCKSSERRTLISRFVHYANLNFVSNFCRHFTHFLTTSASFRLFALVKRIECSAEVRLSKNESSVSERLILIYVTTRKNVSFLSSVTSSYASLWLSSYNFSASTSHTVGLSFIVIIAVRRSFKGCDKQRQKLC